MRSVPCCGDDDDHGGGRGGAPTLASALDATCLSLVDELRSAGARRSGVRDVAVLTRLHGMINGERDLRADEMVELASRLGRVARLCRLVSPGIGTIASHLQPILVERAIARGMVAMTAEIVRGLAPSRSPAVEIYMAMEVAWEGLTLAIACPDRSDRPVMDASGMRAFRRADDIARALDGGLVRGISDGRMVFGFRLAGFASRAS